MTPEEWKAAESSLSYVGDKVEFLIGGRKVTLMHVLIKEKTTYKSYYMTYIDGIFKSEWIVNKDAYERKYLCRKTTQLIKKSKNKQRRKFNLMLKEMGITGEIESYTPYWGSFRTFKSQIKNRFNEEQIILVKEVKDDNQR